MIGQKSRGFKGIPVEWCGMKFRSIRALANHLGMNYTLVNMCVNGDIPIRCFHAHRLGKPNKRHKNFVCLETGRIYKSVNDFVDEYMLDGNSGVYQVLNGKQKTVAGVHIKDID